MKLSGFYLKEKRLNYCETGWFKDEIWKFPKTIIIYDDIENN